MSRTGPRFRVRRVEGAPVVSVRLWVRGGQRAEPQPGLGWACGRMLTEGTARRTWLSIAEDAEDLGAAVRGFSGTEVHGVALDGLCTDWRTLLSWGHELLYESTFPADRLAWLVRRGRGELTALYDPPDSATWWAFLQQLYGPHPRSRPPQGTLEALPELRPEALSVFHAASRHRGVLLTVAGRIDEEEVERWVRDHFGEMAAGDGAAVVPPSPPPAAGQRQERRVGGQGQAHLFLGQLTVPRWHADETALELAGVVLGAGAGLTGRIPQRVREQEGLAYTATAATVQDAATDPGRATFYVGTSVETVDRAEAAVREELLGALEQGMTADEVEAARAYLLGREPFRRETARQWSSRLAEALYWDRPIDDLVWCRERLCRPTADDVTAALRRHLRPASLMVTVGI